MYYLQSRYYDPELGRFINADAFASTGQGILGNNMFAYCGNNPVTRYDPFGCAFTDVFAICLGGPAKQPNYIERAYDIGNRSVVTEGTISINMDTEADTISDLKNFLSLDVICDAIAIAACDKYYAVCGQEFLLSDACVSFEIKGHVDAYYWSVGDQLLPNYLATGYYLKQLFGPNGYNAGSVYAATCMIDMRESDVATDNIQAWAFAYWAGIRDVYIGTEKDPWAKHR